MSVDQAVPASMPGQIGGWSVRRCGVEDADALAQVGAATFLESYAGWLPGRDILAHCRMQHTARAYADLLQQPETRAWIAEVKDAPVAYAVLTRPEMPADLVSDHDAELKRIYVFSRFHGSGMAEELLQAAVMDARERQCRRLLVGAHAENMRALRFYAKHGFTEIGRRSFRMGGTLYDDPVLSRSLEV